MLPVWPMRLRGKGFPAAVILLIPAHVLNYTNRETPWTRIIEHKWFRLGNPLFFNP